MQARENYRIWAYLSFIHHKTHETCMKVDLFSQINISFSFKDLTWYCYVKFWGDQALMLDGWEVHSYAMIASLQKQIASLQEALSFSILTLYFTLHSPCLSLPMTPSLHALILEMGVKLGYPLVYFTSNSTLYYSILLFCIYLAFILHSMHFAQVVFPQCLCPKFGQNE